MQILARDIGFVDIRFQDKPHIIATAIVQGAGGVALVDPGPTSCLPALREELKQSGITFRDVRHIVLTHIHLDHAGATGTLLRERPDIQVFVHERGVRHLVDPSRLLASAGRLYGSRLHELWGDVEPVAESNIRSLTGGERIRIGDRVLDVEYTPGHASHHVSFFDTQSGVAFVGDTAGIRTGPGQYVLPPTPPPDIDLELWRASIAHIEQRRPAKLFLTHFGSYDDIAQHLQMLVLHLEETSNRVRALLGAEGTDEERAARFADEMRRHLQQHLSDSEETLYYRAAPFELNWMGLARYWRKKMAC